MRGASNGRILDIFKARLHLLERIARLAHRQTKAREISSQIDKQIGD